MRMPWQKKQMVNVKGSPTMKAALEAQIGHKLLGIRLEQAQQMTTTIPDPTAEGGFRESFASVLFTRSIVATLGHGEIGDRFPITRKNQQAWRKMILLLQHAEEKYGMDNPYTQAIAKTLYRTEIDFVMRSIKAKHTDVEIAMPPDYLMGGQAGWRNKTDRLDEQ